ncbi:Amino acid permease [Pleurostoma richardsiae]|uniref:Amino acid permease n=1 Tax=Pleurostoma richardsiae TaxID=41990 RepID=A0AA38VRI0_9PEZI|nr:Amino acid permease [Pleurostoma richardsiae]
MFSDGIYTTGGVPKSDWSNVANFTSNSIACSGYEGVAITVLKDFGTTAKGPLQTIPFFYNNGERESVTGVWPNQNIATLCSGLCGVSFPAVVNRTAIAAGADGTLYNTGVEVTLTAYGPVASRPTQSLFLNGEPQYGTFGTLAGIDGYLYMFASITETSSSNGLKMARVPQSSWSSRSQYQFWNGASWVSTMPAYNDGGAANVFSWSENPFGTPYGPGSGDIFYSQYYGTYILIFQSAAAAIDPNVYLSYSSSLSSGWSTPVSIYQIPQISDGYSYSLHAYPNYDSQQRVVPISWSTYSTSQSYSIGMANITFS